MTEPRVDPIPPAFTDAELQARRVALRAVMAARGIDVLVGYGAHRAGPVVPWLTCWPVTREAVVLLGQDDPVELLVGFYNHVPEARRLARGPVTVDWCGEDTATTLAQRLTRRGRGLSVGTVGAIPARVAAALGSCASTVVPLDADHTRLRQTKSPEELTWLRHAAALTDDSARALIQAATPGRSELELVAAVEAAYAGTGGANHIHYLASTSMAAPDRCAPGQWPGRRVLASGDVVVFELSTTWGPDYPGQVLRTVTVTAEPTPLYCDLHAVAEAVLAEIVPMLRPGVAPTQLLAAAKLVEAAGFVTVDDIVHGLGGGYLPPVLSSRSQVPHGLDAEPLRAGMTLVVQPNVCTPDLQAGVQTGELFLVTDGEPVSLHRLPTGMLPGGQAPAGGQAGS
ncbi:MAG TPA: M24 family metallopeptidase [Actinomycetes bacterium]|nr:M24 family metallopeptidase [Actinomycetes bacterium]